MHQSVKDAFIPFNEPLEDRVPFMYMDILGLVSTGIGNKLEENGHLLPEAFTLGWSDKITHVPASNAEIEQEYQTVKNSGTAMGTHAQKEAVTRLRITNSAIDTLVMTKLAQMETLLRARPPFAGLDLWPAPGQLGLFSMAWAMGPAFNFPSFQAAAQSEDWLTMARESHMDDSANPGLVPRNVRNGLLFSIAGWWAAPPPGDFSNLVYEPGLSLADNMRSRHFAIPLNLVIGLQTALEALGFNPTALTGFFGPNTRAALKNFEIANGLPQSPTPQTIDAVNTATIDELAAQLNDLDPPIDHFRVLAVREPADDSAGVPYGAPYGVPYG